VMPPLVYIPQPAYLQRLFDATAKTKYFLKHVGLNEFINYSMTSAERLHAAQLNPSRHLKISNTISQEIEYMRTKLLPSLLQNIKDNIGKKEELSIFEIAKTYHKVTDDLPTETYHLSFATTNDYSYLKGVLEALFHELRITNVLFDKDTNDMFSPDFCVSVKTDNNLLGYFGEIRADIRDVFGIKPSIIGGEFDFELISSSYNLSHPFVEPIQFAIIKLDATIDMNGKTYQDICNTAYSQSQLLINLDYIDTYKDNITIRFYFADRAKNITEEVAKNELKKILDMIKE
jgi:phenylalanyl-tRNA synthetase beta chain